MVESNDTAGNVGDETLNAPLNDTTTALPGPPPATLGGYRIGGLLGRGGMASVYRAEQMSLGRAVALKIIGPPHTADQGFCERFLREARLAAAVNHPNIITVFDAGQDRGFLYMALELVGGDAAKATTADGGRLDERRALRVATDCCHGLITLDHAGLIHRDIKPANIFLTDGPGGERAKLADLGLARKRDDQSLTAAGAAMGTPAYMSPEQAQGEVDIDIRTDIYALGATLYALLTGQPPFIGTTAWTVVAKVMQQSAPDPRHAQPGISNASASIVLHCLKKDRNHRYRRPQDLLEDLECAIAGSPLRHAPLITHPSASWDRVASSGPVPKDASRNRSTAIAPRDELGVDDDSDPLSGKGLWWILGGVGVGAIVVILAMQAGNRVPTAPGKRSVEADLSAIAAEPSEDPLRPRTPMMGPGELDPPESPAQRIPPPHRDPDPEPPEPVAVIPPPTPVAPTPPPQVVAQAPTPTPLPPPVVIPEPVLPEPPVAVRELEPIMPEPVVAVREPEPKPAPPAMVEIPPVAVPTPPVVVTMPEPPVATITPQQPQPPTPQTDPGTLSADQLAIRQASANARQSALERTGFRCRIEVLATGNLSVSMIDRNITSLVPLQGLAIERLDIERCDRLTGDLGALTGMPLKELRIAGCSKLTGLRGIKGAPIERLTMSGCSSLTGDLSTLRGMRLSELDLHGCSKLTSLDGLENMPLVICNAGDCSALTSIAGLQGCPLRTVILRGAKNLSGDLHALSNAPLETLDITGCERLTSLNGITVTVLRQFSCNNCSALTSLAPLRNAKLTTLDIGGCSSLNSLDGLQGMPLRELRMYGCRNLSGDFTAVRGAPLTLVDASYCSNMTSLNGLQESPLQKVILTRNGGIRDYTELAGIRGLTIER